MRAFFLLFFSFIIFHRLLCTENTRENIVLQLGKITNNTETTILVYYKGRTILVKKSNLVNLNPALIIPYSPFIINKNEELFDIPYIPKNALVIKIGSEWWGLWVDERGIFAARMYDKTKNNREDCLPQKLLSFEMIQKLEHLASQAHQAISAIKFFLIVESGEHLKVQAIC